MEDDLLVSVIVPVYNLENYLERCVQSILVQTYKNVEIILVDDGSTDHSKAVIEQLMQQDNRVKGVFKKNGGVTSARLAGVKKAKGTFIGFVDGDDEIEADMYELLVKNAEKYQADISHCGYQMQFADGRIHYFYNTGTIREQDNITGLKDLLEGDLIEPGLWNKLYHRKLFDNLLNNNLMDCSIKINEDLLMNYYLFKEAEKSIFEDVCKYHYLIRQASASRRMINKNKIEDPIKVKRIIFNQIDNELKQMAKRVYLRTCINVYNEIVLSNKQKEYKVYLDWIIMQLKKQKKNLFSLGKKQTVLAFLMIYCSAIINVLYPLYVRRIQKKKYE